MELWIMAAPYNVAAHRFMNKMAKAGRCPCRVFPTVSSLIARLRRPVSGAPVLILFPKGRRELEKLLAARHLMRDLRLILVLDDAGAESLSVAHRLRPRYIAYSDSNLSDLVAVTTRMASLSGTTFKVADNRALA